jgi:hypothetical protein
MMGFSILDSRFSIGAESDQVSRLRTRFCKVLREATMIAVSSPASWRRTAVCWSGSNFRAASNSSQNPLSSARDPAFENRESKIEIPALHSFVT